MLAVTTIYGRSPSTVYAATDLSSYNTSIINWARNSYVELGNYLQGTMPSSGYGCTIRTKVACKVMYWTQTPSSSTEFNYHAAQSYSAYQSVVSVPAPGSVGGYSNAGACLAVLLAIKE